MKYIIIIIIFLGLQSQVLWTQENAKLNLKNVLVVSQQDDLSDRYSLEIALLQLFNDYKIKSKASLNIVKEGGNLNVLASDSVQKKLEDEGIDTYLLVSVRGFDSRFKPSKKPNDLKEELNAGHLFPLYRENASRVTFSFIFYRDGKPVYYELIRTGTVSSKEATIKKLMKKVNKRLSKNWL